MITFIRSVVAMPSKLEELLAVAKESVPVNKRLHGLDVAIAASFGGQRELAWVLDAPGVGHLEDAANKLMTDAEYRAILKKMETLVMPGSVRDQIWRHV